MSEQAGERGGQPPVLLIEAQSGSIELRWDNCHLWTFAEPMYNHVIVTVPTTEGGEMQLAFMPPEEVVNALLSFDFPNTFSPVVTDAQREWFIEQQVRLMEQELGESASPEPREGT